MIATQKWGTLMVSVTSSLVGNLIAFIFLVCLPQYSLIRSKYMKFTLSVVNLPRYNKIICQIFGSRCKLS